MNKTEQRQCRYSTKLLCTVCPQADKDWDLDRLFSDMGFIKAILNRTNYESINDISDEDWEYGQQNRQELKPKEKCWLCLLLQGYDVEKIEQYLALSHIKGDLSRGIYKWVYLLTEKKITNWAQVPNHLHHNVSPKVGSSYRKAGASDKWELGIGIEIPESYREQIPRIIEIIDKIDNLERLGLDGLTMEGIESETLIDNPQGEQEDEQD